jgi:SAM-dependent methyltransferase
MFNSGKRLEVPGNLCDLNALDLACGGGRHSRYLAEQGFKVHAVDKQMPPEPMGEGIRFEQLDLEKSDTENPGADKQTWPLPPNAYDLIVVTNYLYRPTFNRLLDCLKQGGVLVYETFMDGNAQFGSPKNPDFLLKAGELLELTKPLQVLAFEQGLRVEPSMAMIQRVMCIKGDWTEIQSLIHLENSSA